MQRSCSRGGSGGREGGRFFVLAALSCFILSCLVLPCLVLAYDPLDRGLTLPCLFCILSCLALNCVVLPCLVLLSCLVMSCRYVPCLVLTCFASCCVVFYFVDVATLMDLVGCRCWLFSLLPPPPPLPLLSLPLRSFVSSS